MSVYKAQLEQDEDGRLSAWIESLPGCAARGDTQDDALVALREAADAYLEDMTEVGEAVAHEGEVVIENPIVTA